MPSTFKFSCIISVTSFICVSTKSSCARESLTVKDEDKKQVKHSNEQDDMTVDKEMYNLSESSIMSNISTSEQCLLSGEEDSGGNEVVFDENGNRRTADQHFNPVAIEIACFTIIFAKLLVSVE
jgi:hypothetical protein